MKQKLEQFEDLEAWKEARRLVRSVYHITRESDIARDFGLIHQIQRASVSILSNLAEGFERIGIQEKLNFYNIARASCAEVRSLLYVIQDNYPGQHAHIPDLQTQAQTTGKLVSGLHASTKKRLNC